MHKVLDFIKKNKQFSFFLLLVILLALITIFAPVIAPQDPYVSDLKNANQSKTNQTETRTVNLNYSKLPGKLLVNQVQVWKSGLDDLDKATPKTLEESSSVPSLPNTTTK